MKTILVFITVLLLPLALCAAEPISIGSEDIQEIINSKNSRVAGKDQVISAMNYRQGFLKRSFMPTVLVRGAQERFTLGSDYTRTQPDYGAEVIVNIYNGSKDKLYGDLMDKRKDRISSERRVVLYTEVIRAKELYWNLVFLDAKMKLLQDTMAMNKNNHRAAERRIRGGVATQADRFEFEMKGVDMQREMDQITMQKNIYQRELIALLGYAEGSMIRAKQELVHEHDLQNLAHHTEAQHRFLAQPSSLQADEHDISANIESRSWWPRVDAYAGYNRYNVRTGNVFDAQEGEGTVVGLRVVMDTSKLVSGNREASALKAEAEGAKSEARYLERAVENEAHSEIETLHFLHAQVHSAEENVQRADRYFKLTLQEYGRGVKNSPDVLGATDKWIESQTKYLEILRDFQVTRDHLVTKNQI